VVALTGQAAEVWVRVFSISLTPFLSRTNDQHIYPTYKVLTVSCDSPSGLDQAGDEVGTLIGAPTSEPASSNSNTIWLKDEPLNGQISGP